MNTKENDKNNIKDNEINESKIKITTTFVNIAPVKIMWADILFLTFFQMFCHLVL